MRLGIPLRQSILGTTTLLLAACGGGSGGGAAPPQPNQLNTFPTVVGHNTNQNAFIGHFFTYDVDKDGLIFDDANGDALTYVITFNNSATPPAGLTVNGSQLSGTPTQTGGFGITIQARDGRGGTVTDSFFLAIKENLPPQVTHPNQNRIVQPGPVNYDTTQNGTTFTDPDGHSFTYRLSIVSSVGSFAVQGLRIVGNLTAPGFVRGRLEATDELGATSEDLFALVVPASVSARPTLTAFTYADAELPLPERYQPGFDPELWDTMPPTNLTTNAGATLGRVLFYDKRLSITNTHSCASCHQQAKGFADPHPFSLGVFNEPTKRNAMSLANVRFRLNGRYFWDQRAVTLETLALMPIQDLSELGSSLQQVVDELSATDFYPPLFAAAFGTPDVTGERVALALAQFMRSLISYRARFDQAFLMNQPPDSVLTEQELRGQGAFVPNCEICHTNVVQATESEFNNGLDLVSEDSGVGNGLFRAPSLRNIAVSGPYMHDGRFATLAEVIEQYSSGVQPASHLSAPLIRAGGFNFSAQQKAELEAFLNTLTDAPMLADPKFSDPFQ